MKRSFQTDMILGRRPIRLLRFEDKIPPTIECRDVVIMCGAQLPDVPAPAIVGYQEQIQTGLNDLLDLNTLEYTFDYSYLPTTPPRCGMCNPAIDHGRGC
ncbi:MAG: hypothetical protein IPP25_21065 [Saprospiraceae bacterium]|nr:hypothetical protein [Candidatus Opimibacter skivensis]